MKPSSQPSQHTPRATKIQDLDTGSPLSLFFFLEVNTVFIIIPYLEAAIKICLIFEQNFPGTVLEAGQLYYCLFLWNSSFTMLY